MVRTGLMMAIVAGLTAGVAWGVPTAVMAELSAKASGLMNRRVPDSATSATPQPTVSKPSVPPLAPPLSTPNPQPIPIPVVPAPTLTDSKRSLIRDVIRASGTQQMLQQLVDLALTQFQRDVPGLFRTAIANAPNTSPYERQMLTVVGSLFDQLFMPMLNQFRDRLDLNRLLERVYYPAYNERFSDQELRDLLAVYQNPTNVATATPPNPTATELLKAHQTLTDQVILPRVRQVVEQEAKQISQQIRQTPAR